MPTITITLPPEITEILEQDDNLSLAWVDVKTGEIVIHDKRNGRYDGVGTWVDESIQIIVEGDPQWSDASE